MIIINNRTVPCNPRSKNYAKGTVVNVSGSTSTPAFVYTPTYDDIINVLKNGKDYITIPTILEVYGDLYSLGEVSAFGAGSGTGGGSGLIQTVYGLSGLGGTYSDTVLTNTFNAYAINSLHNRINSLEAGSALNFTTAGSGNAVTSVTKSGNAVTVTKGLTFSVDGHTHIFDSLTSKPTTLSGYGITDALLASAYTAADVLTKIKTVDGSGSGLDADTLDGKHIEHIYSKMSEFTLASEISSADKVWVANSSVTDVPSMSYSALLHVGNDASRRWQIWNARGINKLYWRPEKDDMSDFDSVRTLIDDYNIGNFNAGSATKLANTRTIWGQSFNGEENVSGNLTGVGTISASGTITAPTFSGALSGNSSSATRLQIARTIAGVSFDGTDNIAIPFNNLSSKPTTISGYGITDAYTKTQTDGFLALKLDVATFSDLFEKVNVGTTTSPVYAIKAKYNFYSVGEVSAFGAGTGSGGSGLIQTVYGYAGLGSTYSDATLTNTFNAYTINRINTDLSARIASLEAGSAISFATVGSGNAVTSVTKSGTSVTVTKGLTFSVDGHTHTFASLTSKPTTLAGYGITDALLASAYTADDVLAKIKTVDGAGSGLDADLLDGTHLKSIIGFDTKRDFINGTLITTDIDYSGTEGSPFYLEIKGNAYVRGYPCLTQAQGYIYSNTITNYGVTHLGYVGIFGLVALNVNGRLCFWFPRQSYWEGYSIFVSDAYNTSYNRVIAIDDVAKPAGTKEVIISEHTATSAFLDSNVASASKLSTSRTIWGQTDADGTGNISGAMSGVTSLTMSGALSGGTTSSFSSYSTANRFYTGYDANVANSMSCSGWFRSNGSTGWLNDTYGGGITMTDSNYVKVYNSKSFWVDNNIVATGEITAFGASDIRLKDNVKPISSALDFLGRVKTYEFDWNDKALSLNPLKTKKGAGVIAQELQTLDSDFVHSIYGEYLGVDYDRFIPYLIGGVNEIADEVTILKNKVKYLEDRLNSLEKSN